MATTYQTTVDNSPSSDHRDTMMSPSAHPRYGQQGGRQSHPHYQQNYQQYPIQHQYNNNQYQQPPHQYQQHHQYPKRRVITPPSRPQAQAQHTRHAQSSPDQVFEKDPVVTQPKWKIFKNNENKIYEHKKNGSDDSLPVMPTIAMGYENSIQNQLQSRGELRITNDGYFFDNKGKGRPQHMQQVQDPYGYPPPQMSGYQMGYPPPLQQQYYYGAPSSQGMIPGPYAPQPEYKEGISPHWEYERFNTRYDHHWMDLDPPMPQQQLQSPVPVEPRIHPVYDPEFRSKQQAAREREREKEKERERELEWEKERERELEKNDAIVTTPRGHEFESPRSNQVESNGDGGEYDSIETLRPEILKQGSYDSFVGRATALHSHSNSIQSLVPTPKGAEDGAIRQEYFDPKSVKNKIETQELVVPMKSSSNGKTSAGKTTKKKGFLKKMFGSSSSGAGAGSSGELKKRKNDKSKRSITPSKKERERDLVISPLNNQLQVPPQQQQLTIVPPPSPGYSNFSMESQPSPQIVQANSVQDSNRNRQANVPKIPIISNIFHRIDESNLTPNSKLIVKLSLIFWVFYEIHSVLEILGEYWALVGGVFNE